MQRDVKESTSAVQKPLLGLVRIVTHRKELTKERYLITFSLSLKFSSALYTFLLKLITTSLASGFFEVSVRLKSLL